MGDARGDDFWGDALRGEDETSGCEVLLCNMGDLEEGEFLCECCCCERGFTSGLLHELSEERSWEEDEGVADDVRSYMFGGEEPT